MGGLSLFVKKRNNDGWKTLVTFSLIAVLLIWKAIIDSWHIFFYIVCLALWIILYYSIDFIQKRKITKPASLWKEYLKKYPIIIQYAPPKWINPAEAWLLYNCSVEPTDLTSLIYQWKFEKLIDIKIFTWENSKREFIKLIKKDDMPLTRPLFESEIFDSIFSMGDVKIIEWAFQLRYALMLEDLEYHWIQKWWVKMWWNVDKKSKHVAINLGRHYDWIDEFWNQVWSDVLIFWIFLFIVILSIIMESFNVSNNLSQTFSEFLWFIGFLFLIFLWIILYYWTKEWWWKLKYTDKWAKLASEVIGYSQFIKSCDKNKIELLLKEDPLFIDRTLPYATAFWMETEFLKKISPLKKDWNARYYKWKKVPHWIWVLRFFTKDENSFF